MVESWPLGAWKFYFLNSVEKYLIDIGNFSALDLCDHLDPVGFQNLEGHVVLQVLQEVQHLLLQRETRHVVGRQRFQALKEKFIFGVDITFDLEIIS